MLFSDIRGFTPLSERLGPPATVALLNDYLTRMDFTVMGDGVNLAARLESASKQYRAPALLSDSTLRALKGTFRSREIDRVKVVGRPEPVPIHELMEHHDEASFPGLIDGLAAFRDGLALYRARRFADAAATFERALAVSPADGVSALYVARCRQLQAKPPPDEWDGVWVLTEK
jgi:adenylate cyclase